MLFNKSVAACVAALSLALLASCSKKADSANPVFGNLSHDQLHVYTDPSVAANDLSHLSQLFSVFKSAPQTFTVTAGQYYRVWGVQGTMLRFYPNSFRDAAGNVITAGTVEIKLVEMYKPGAMIANRAITTDNGALLNSGGQVSIIATLNGQPVYASKYGVGFAQSAPVGQPMELYYGNRQSSDSVVRWTEASPLGTGNAVASTVTLNDSIQGPNPVAWQGPQPPPGNHYYYLFDSCTDFTMINCDHFTGYPDLTDIQAVVPDSTFQASNTDIYIIFPDINSVTKFKHYDYGTNTFTLGTSYNVPAGHVVTIVAMTNNNGNYYYYEAPNITVTPNMVINIAMQPQTYTFIATALSNL